MKPPKGWKEYKKKGDWFDGQWYPTKQWLKEFGELVDKLKPSKKFI